MLVICFAVLPMSWSLRNASRGGGFTVSTIASWSLLFDRAAATLAVEDPGGFSTDVIARRRQLAVDAGETEVEAATYSNHVLRPGEKFHEERYGRIAVGVLLHHPVAYIWVSVIALGRTLFGGGAAELSTLTGLPPLRALALVATYTLATTLIVVLGCVRVFRMDRSLFWLSAAFVAYFLVASSVAEATSRFRVPIMPVAAIWFGYGCLAIENLIVRRAQAGRPAPA